MNYIKSSIEKLFYYITMYGKEDMAVVHTMQLIVRSYRLIDKHGNAVYYVVMT